MINKNTRSFICGIKGYKLSKTEIKFLRKYKPWGIILFSRNLKKISQIQKLTNHIKKIFKDKKKFNLYFDVYVKQISYLLRLLGINVNTVPVLDILRKNLHQIVGDRSFSSNKKIVSKIGDICIDKFHKNKIATITKHIPGHGLAKVDSHLKLPIIDKNQAYLLKNDFSVFSKKKSKITMTGHLMFKKLDSKNPVTHSKKIIRIIRNKIKFNELIITDDISMKALNNNIEDNVIKSFSAGCNLVLHCNGKMSEMLKVAKNSPKINNFVIKKTSQITNIIS